MAGYGYGYFQGGVPIVSNVNPQPSENALKFEGTEEYIFFEGQSEPDYITFETN